MKARPIPQSRTNSKKAAIAAIYAALCVALAASNLCAQYPGTPAKKAGPGQPKLRSTAILEWVGDPGKPSASRIIPIAVYDGQRYQDGGLYLAQPEPLAVSGGTEYELQQAGVPQGTFEIFSAGRIDANWFGFGAWKPIPPAPVSKLKVSKTPPAVVTEVDPDKPTFAHKDKSGDAAKPGDAGKTSDPDKSAAKPDSTTTSPTPAPPDPDRPTLHKRSASDTAGGDSAGQDASKSAPVDAVDPDRPTLHKHQADPSVGAAITDRDPDRPTVRRGRPQEGDVALQASRLVGEPPDIQQMAAVSDNSTGEDHPFLFEWSDPADAAKAQAKVEALASQAIAASLSPPAKKGGTAGGRRAGSHVGTHASSTGAHGKAKPPAAPALPLRDEKFGAYQLAYNGPATFVLTATSGDGDAEKSIAIVAQPDFDGVPHVLFQSITDPLHLDVTPRMRFIDAVDTSGDNQADLVFELRNQTDRQFAIYHVNRSGAQQVFATGSLPARDASPNPPHGPQ